MSFNDMTLHRRALIRNAFAAGAVVATGGVWAGLAAGPAGAASPYRGGYGPLVADPAGILDLPAGFQYKILAKGSTLYDGSGRSTYDDGQPFAGYADGAASFAIAGNRTALVTNHEVRIGLDGEVEDDPGDAVPHTFRGEPVPTYDPEDIGGCSVIVVDRNNEVVGIRPAIAGTRNNCAGGPTPWGTWLTCEENTDEGPTKPHGYVFEVDPSCGETVATPYTGMGRMDHEAVAIDPRTSIAYLTEDDGNGSLYRYVPNNTSMRYGSLHADGGTLSCMKVGDLERLGEVTVPGTELPLEWLEIAEPDVGGLNSTLPDGVTRSDKLEGCWWNAMDNRFWFVVSEEGEVEELFHRGQVWAYDPATGLVELMVHIPGPDEDMPFDGPDNITIAPWGQPFLCEDGDGDQFVIGVDPDGSLWPLAQNRIEVEDEGELEVNEFAGANFSPDCRTLFVSVQVPGTTFAITGPWGEVRNGA
ncbi:MAG: DUF839 domain-containing protein [Actinomycetota bacterium]|nr:DUF839 domain-containing protein [Actinomycetota bacterium]